MLIVVAAGENLAEGKVERPSAFLIVILGFTLFLASKLSVISRKKWISSGARLMTPRMGNVYRLGYWLMAVGVLATFV